MHYKEAITRLRQLVSEWPDIAGNEMVNFGIDNIRSESFAGTKWPPRKSNAPRNKGRGLLIDTGDGMRSIRVSRKTSREVHATANEYMEAHNTGATISGTFAVKPHTRRRAGGTQKVRGHSRKVNFKLPQRTFLAPSKELSDRITAAMLKRYNTLIR
jgi:phage gpG-like protein